VKVAQKMGDFYVLDKVHDELVNRFYDSLVQKGLIEKE
jgi:glucose dehydrogenase